MMRNFTFALPADTNYHNLYASILAVTGAVPTDGILPDRVSILTIRVLTATSTIFIGDANNANSAGMKFVTADPPFQLRSERNTICLRDYYIKGNAGSESIEVMIESK